MTKTLRKSAKTEDEAIKLALAELGVERDDVSIQLIERAKAGFFGIGASPAIIEVTYEASEEISYSSSAKSDANENTELKKTAIHQDNKKTESHARENVKSETAKIENAKRHDQAPIQDAASKKEPPDRSKEAMSKEAIENRVKSYLEGLIERTGFTAIVTVKREDSGDINVLLESEEAGSIIGRRGETLEAMQSLTNYTINKNLHHRIRITIDTEGYRQRRDETLISLAEKTAARVIKYRRNITLEPMNAYERHIIHATLQEYDGVSTHSVGSEPNRRVVVVCERAGFTEPGSFSVRDNHGNNTEVRHRRDIPRAPAGKHGSGRRDSFAQQPSAPRPQPANIEAYSAPENPNYKEWK